MFSKGFLQFVCPAICPVNTPLLQLEVIKDKPTKDEKV